MARVYFDERTNLWCMDYEDAEGRRKRVKAGRTKTQAEEMLRKRLDEVHKEKVYGKPVNAITIENFANDHYLPYAKANKKPSSYGRDITSFKHLIEAFKHKKLSEITAKDVEIYKEKRTAEVEKATVNKELALLKNVFTKAIHWNFAEKNPVKLVKLFKVSNDRIRFLKHLEIDFLLACCPERIKPIVLMAILTGMRKGEIFNLKWNEVDMQNDIITVKDTKNYQTRHIPINKTLHEALQNVIRSANDRRVFWDTTNFRKDWEGAIKRAGITDFRFHDLRHTFASYLVMNGENLKTVQELLGHKTLTMTLRYAHLAPEHKKKAMEKLGEAIIGLPENKVKNGTYMAHSKVAVG